LSFFKKRKKVLVFIVFLKRKQRTLVRTINKFIEVINTLFVAVFVFRGKTTQQVKDETYGNVKNIGQIVRGRNPRVSSVEGGIVLVTPINSNDQWAMFINVQ
jgi:hypothetical protein